MVYNDYDNFSKRLASVAQTNVLLDKIRVITKDLIKDKLIPDSYKNRILEHQKGVSKCQEPQKKIRLSKT